MKTCLLFSSRMNRVTVRPDMCDHIGISASNDVFLIAFQNLIEPNTLRVHSSFCGNLRIRVHRSLVLSSPSRVRLAVRPKYLKICERSNHGACKLLQKAGVLPKALTRRSPGV